MGEQIDAKGYILLYRIRNKKRTKNGQKMEQKWNKNGTKMDQK